MGLLKRLEVLHGTSHKADEFGFGKIDDESLRARVLEYIKGVPVKYQGRYAKAVLKGGRRDMIHALCMICSSHVYSDVENCGDKCCPLWNHRPGRDKAAEPVSIIQSGEVVPVSMTGMARKAKTSLATALKMFCARCVKYDRREVALCESMYCPAWQYRPWRKNKERFLAEMAEAERREQENLNRLQEGREKWLAEKAEERRRKALDSVVDWGNGADKVVAAPFAGDPYDGARQIGLLNVGIHDDCVIPLSHAACDFMEMRSIKVTEVRTVMRGGGVVTRRETLDNLRSLAAKLYPVPAVVKAGKSKKKSA